MLTPRFGNMDRRQTLDDFKRVQIQRDIVYKARTRANVND